MNRRRSSPYNHPDELWPEWAGAAWDQRVRFAEPEFRCKRCGALVTTDPLLSGVNNRNHCPYCLWSRHMDLLRAGDRLAACKSRMRPIGLTLKTARKKYVAERSGELMLAHQCEECGRLSINRIAADDDAGRILEVFTASLSMDRELRLQAELGGIRLLAEADRRLVRARLYGEQK